VTDITSGFPFKLPATIFPSKLMSPSLLSVAILTLSSCKYRVNILGSKQRIEPTLEEGDFNDKVVS